MTLDILFAIAVYNAMSNEIQWCWNVVRFWLWWAVFVSAIGNLKDAKAELIKKGRSLPAWWQVGYDLVLAVWLSAHGHFFYASMALVMSILQTAACTPTKKAL